LRKKITRESDLVLFEGEILIGFFAVEMTDTKALPPKEITELNYFLPREKTKLL